MNVMRVLAIAALGIMSAGSASAQTDRPPTWYNLNDPRDTSSVELMGLDSIAGPPTDTSLVVVNLFHLPKQDIGNIVTWHIDCVHARMHMSDIMSFSPNSHSEKKAITGEVIKTTASPTSRKLSGLACSGNGQLERSRVDHRELSDIVRAFWTTPGNRTDM